MRICLFECAFICASIEILNLLEFFSLLFSSQVDLAFGSIRIWPHPSLAKLNSIPTKFGSTRTCKSEPARIFIYNEMHDEKADQLIFYPNPTQTCFDPNLPNPNQTRISISNEMHDKNADRPVFLPEPDLNYNPTWIWLTHTRPKFNSKNLGRPVFDLVGIMGKIGSGLIYVTRFCCPL